MLHIYWLLTVFGALVAGLAHAQHGGVAATSAERYAAWGAETLDAVKRDLWLADRGLYAERSRGRGRRPLRPAFMWGCGVQLSALAAAARFDRDAYQEQLTSYADALQDYWSVANGLGGYDVLPGQAAPDRYYDDNAWMVLALAETFTVTNEPRFLDRARATMQFVLSGEDDTRGGGIYWRENTRDTKNTCSNAPTIVAALVLHQLTGEADYLATADRLYSWTCDRLQDPEDGLFWDHVRADGEIDRRKFTYNTALMIRANCLLFAIQGDVGYRREAERLAAAAADHWLVPETGAIRDGGRFAHMLLEAWLAVDETSKEPTWRAAVEQTLAFVHDRVRDPRGRYANRWDEAATRPLRSFQLLDQASAARIYFVTAAAFTDSESSTEFADAP